MQNHILVTGSMRSGTTFVGEVLSQSGNLFYIHEPLNRTWGIEGVEHWFPYVHDETSRYAKLVDQLLTGNFRYKRPANGHWLKRGIKQIVGTPTSWRSVYYRYFVHGRRHMLLKDPLSAFASRYMNEQHGVDVVMLVRHPIAFYYSNRRLGWGFDFQHLLQQEALIDTHLHDEVSLLEREDLSYAQQMGLLWRCVYIVLSAFEDERQNRVDGGAWIAQRHEDLCLTPEETFADMMERLNIPFTGTIRSIVRRKTRSQNSVHAHGNTAHQTERNSQRLAEYWKDRVDRTAVRQIRELTGEVASRYYNEASWEVDAR